MFFADREPSHSALDKLKVRVARDTRALRDALDDCPEGLVPDRVVAALRARVVAFAAVAPIDLHGAAAVRG